MNGNEEVFNLLTLCSTQWRAGFSGAYGLDYNVVIELARALEVEIDQTFLEKVRAFEHEVLRIWNEKDDKGRCDDRQKEKCRLEFGEFFEWACKNCEKMKKEEE